MFTKLCIDEKLLRKLIHQSMYRLFLDLKEILFLIERRYENNSKFILRFGSLIDSETNTTVQYNNIKRHTIRGEEDYHCYQHKVHQTNESTAQLNIHCNSTSIM